MKRLRLEIKGKVQGVGFRPFVYRIAKKLNLTGFVFNHTNGVTVEIQGELLYEFVKDLDDLPPLAIIDSIDTNFIDCNFEETDFVIIKSEETQGYNAKILPDVCICDDCLSELFCSNNRYFRYPFLNCTNCGPRFTIIYDVPYDRAKTSMNEFPLCCDCEKDYKNPENRRFHAEPTACEKCGPKLTMTILDMVKFIKGGKILAIKGQGGYQLICDAKNENAVLKLRKRKNRDEKPFALMALNLKSAKEFVNYNLQEEKLLMSKERPIVLLQKKENEIAESVAKGLSNFGIMLPYTPLHYLLFNGLSGFPNGLDWLDEIKEDVLVVTSANVSDEPLIIDDIEAQKELKNIADRIVSHNRKILVRADDSVLRVVNDAPYFIRRARGYVPESIKLRHEVPSILAVGGQLKNTFCVTRGDEAFVSQHIGDLDNPKAIQFFHDSLEHLLKILGVRPEYLAHDKHPDFYATRFASEYGLPTISVQHHHAHLESVAAEYHITEPTFGLALDGYGYGENGESWGGELLLLNEEGNYERLGSLKPLPQVGGDAASREGWRMAASVLYELGLQDEIRKRFGDERYSDKLTELLVKNIYSKTSSCGRLFDAASALLGIRNHSKYEGQAAMELESLVTNPVVLENGFSFNEKFLDLLPLMNYLISCDKIEGANIFHGTLAQAFSDWIKYWVEKININTVLLSGGCFLNRILTEEIVKNCKSYGIVPLLPRQFPPNDGGLCLGQAWVGIQKLVGYSKC